MISINKNCIKYLTIEENNIRQIIFIGSEFGEFVGYTNTQKALRDHVDDKYKFTLEKLIDKFSCLKKARTIRSEISKITQPETILITLSGACQLLATSKLKTPIVKFFQDNLYEVILPAIFTKGLTTAPF